MQTKFFLILFGASLGLIILGSIIGTMLESAGVLTKENLGPRGVAAVQAVFFALFCVMSFSLVPLFVKLFLYLQIRVGNAGFPPIRWLIENERSFIWGAWGMIAAGLVIALLLQGKEIVKQFTE